MEENEPKKKKAKNARYETNRKRYGDFTERTARKLSELKTYELVEEYRQAILSYPSYSDEEKAFLLHMCDYQDGCILFDNYEPVTFRSWDELHPKKARPSRTSHGRR